MAIIPGHFCEACADDGHENVPAEYERDSWGDGSGGGGFLCDGHATRMAEDAWERRCEAFYGGSGPQTLNEQCAQAWREKRELERR